VLEIVGFCVAEFLGNANKVHEKIFIVSTDYYFFSEFRSFFEQVREVEKER
jgi:hypothetical protein